ncbi:malonic semialdehyde reductase [Glaciimonas sp. PCH181]|uniref:malonic semialdehyde reductase n=1 Tax=Glaciimonas sp. PCH181 TaxID=2133943 RepID=UPI000D39A9F5|nr:malonic semialdehyde reductase [Glaciimonas sp. PCH181]PUA19485.1 malonic semialdehyde reductase [Glaciimonas sp. PCH181]
MTILSDAALDQLFRTARTHNDWLDKSIPVEQLHALYELVKYGPTSANCSPARFVFVSSEQGKDKIRPTLAPGNLAKTMNAPVTVIVAYDLEFYENLPKLFPHTDAKSWFAGKDAFIQSTAERNSALQGAYLIMAARSLGIDTGPMSGFDNVKLDEAFFSGTKIKSNFLVNLGYGDTLKIFARSPRLNFEEAASIV